MKTAVSIPDNVFKKGARHAPDHVTETMDQVCAEIGPEPDPFISAASRRVLERSEW
jgi:hypothetical protein